MMFPLGLWEISLLLAVTAITLLITSELLSVYYGKINIKINRKKLRNTALAFSITFLATVAIRVASIILNL
jgi:hypothetical protein